MPPVSTLMKLEIKTMGPTDVCLNVGPLGVPVPGPFPGENIPGMLTGTATKTLVGGMPIVLKSSKAPMCKAHGGPMGAAGPGKPLGLGEAECSVSGVTKVKVEGKSPCADGALYTLNAKNTPPTQAKKGDAKVKVT